jgi:hypothetical protein
MMTTRVCLVDHLHGEHLWLLECEIERLLGNGFHHRGFTGSAGRDYAQGWRNVGEPPNGKAILEKKGGFEP